MKVPQPGETIAENISELPRRVKDDKTRDQLEKVYEEAVAVARSRERQAVAKAGLKRPT